MGLWHLLPHISLVMLRINVMLLDDFSFSDQVCHVKGTGLDRDTAFCFDSFLVLTFPWSPKVGSCSCSSTSRDALASSNALVTEVQVIHHGILKLDLPRGASSSNYQVACRALIS
jgi:hypothetical protein